MGAAGSVVEEGFGDGKCLRVEGHQNNDIVTGPLISFELGTTNIVEGPTSGVRLRTRRVTNWRHDEMVLRWAAAAYLDTEKSFRRIMGYRDLWILKAALDKKDQNTEEVRIA